MVIQMKQDEMKIRNIIEKLRPYLISDGGNIDFIKYENNIVYIKMNGACANCSMLDFTLKEGIEAAIKEEVPSVKEIINVEELYIFLYFYYPFYFWNFIIFIHFYQQIF